MVDNIFKHNSRSYYDIYNPLVAAYPNKPTWLFKEMSGLFDFQSELMNRIATDILYPKTRESAYGFAAKCDYTPVESDGATDTITFTLTGTMTKTLATGYQVGGISLVTGQMVIYELTASASSGGTATITAAVKQKRTYSSVNLGTIDSTDDFSDYPIDGYANIVKNTISLFISGNTWTRVDNFDSSISSSKHFKLIYQSSGKSRLQFGDGVTGMKPTSGGIILGTFSTTLGTLGKLNAGEVTINVGADSQIQSLTNAGASGGNDAESVASIIRNSRANARLHTMVWTVEDIEAQARAASSSVQKSKAVPGIGSSGVLIVPAGGGNPSSELKSQVQIYIQALTQFGTMPIAVSDPNYVDSDITATVTVRSGFVSATVKNLVRFAMTLSTCAFDNQVTEYYVDNGIDLCRTNVINVLWSWAFTADENEALQFIIEKWRSLLGHREYREWGQELEVGNIWIMADSLYDFGVDIFNLTVPLVNTNINEDEIINTGTITIT